VGAKLSHEDGWTADRGTDGKTEGRIDMKKLQVAICNFANATKNLVLLVTVGRSNWRSNVCASCA